MKIIVRNSAGIPNKYLRLLKWKLYRLGRRFEDLHYVDIFVKKEGSGHKLYEAVLRLGVPGKDIILRHRSPSPLLLMTKTHKDARRYLSKRSRSYK